MGKFCRKCGAVLFALFLLTIVSGCPQFDYIDIGFDHYWQPKDMPIDFESDTEIDVPFEVQVACSHDIGIKFANKEPVPETVRDKRIQEFFGDTTKGFIFPAEIDIKILNIDNQIVFEKNNFGGRMGGNYYYGPNPVRFVAEVVFLKQGVYHAKIMVKKRDKDFRNFDAFFFASHRPGILCGK